MASTVEKRLYELNKRVEKNATRESHGDLGDAMASFRFLNELRGFWPFSSCDEAGNVYDISNNGRTLVNNGATPRINFTVPYATLNGTTQWLSRVDEAGLDITGGLTFGGWFYANNFTNAYGLMSKDGASGNRSYLLTTIATTGQVASAVFPAGTSASAQVAASSGVMSLSTWHFVVARFTPSTEVAVFLDNVKSANTTAIGATTFNGTYPLNIGAVSGASLLPGRAALCFLCASSIYDAQLSRVFNATRWIFGV